jgi:hypothetical protein
LAFVDEKLKDEKDQFAPYAVVDGEEASEIGGRRRPASGFYGVTANKKRWQARISHGGKDRSLGSFGTKQEAALAYDREARQCGKDKPLNYESIAAAEEAAAAALWFWGNPLTDSTAFPVGCLTRLAR